MRRLLTALLFAAALTAAAQTTSWTADNGNGTFTNPLFYDEFSDPDVLRVGDDYYLAGTTMHTVPGLVILHSKDLVNWENVSYCFDRYDFDDPAFSLEDGKEIYGQGIWAPCIRYNNGEFYIFSNVNGKGLQCYRSKDIRGPWEHIRIPGDIYDLSILFDDDGKVYAIHKYGNVMCTEMKPDMSGPVEGSGRIIIPEGNAVGEGHHAYKINGKYYIISADYRPDGRLTCSRADNIWGPYETAVITADETFGYGNAPMTHVRGRILPDTADFRIEMPDPDYKNCANVHQGGIVSTPDGQWWALQMQDFHSLGRTTTLLPVTWVDGWPMIGLPGNLGRAPRTWFKPETAARDTVTPHAPYERNENFDGPKLGRVWQWNHNPDDRMWSLAKGRLRLKTMPADQLMWARNTLTQRAIGPESVITVELDASHLKDGDVAGLCNINVPCSWIGIVREGKEDILRCFVQADNDTTDLRVSLPQGRIWLRMNGDFDRDRARYAYSTDGSNFTDFGPEMVLSYQLISFQGARPGLFAFNSTGKRGGYAEFDNFTVDEPRADRSGNIPYGKSVRFINLATGRPMAALPHGLMHDAPAAEDNSSTRFTVEDRGNGKVSIRTADNRYVYTAGFGLAGDVRLTDDPAKAEEFLWQDYLGHDFMLMSLRNNRDIGKDPRSGSSYSADFPGADPARRNGAVLHWEE